MSPLRIFLCMIHLRRFLMVWPGLMLALCAVSPAAWAQDDLDDAEAPSANALYLQAVGLDGQAHAIEAHLRAGLDEAYPRMEADRLDRMAEFFAFVMTINGLTFEKAQVLENHGVDLIHAITAGSRPLVEQSLMADLVVLAEVASIDETPGDGDGYRRAITFRVLDTFKGVAPDSTVVMRQERSSSNRRRPPRLDAQVGEQYLLLLSKSMYEFHAAVYAGREGGEEALAAIPEAEWRRRVAPYRWYPYEDGRLLWNNLDRRDTAMQLEDVRWLDYMLRGQ